jgi:hypothetical protein
MGFSYFTFNAYVYLTTGYYYTCYVLLGPASATGYYYNKNCYGNKAYEGYSMLLLVLVLRIPKSDSIPLLLVCEIDAKYYYNNCYASRATC